MHRAGVQQVSSTRKLHAILWRSRKHKGAATQAGGCSSALVVLAPSIDTLIDTGLAHVVLGDSCVAGLHNKSVCGFG